MIYFDEKSIRKSELALRLEEKRVLKEEADRRKLFLKKIERDKKLEEKKHKQPYLKNSVEHPIEIFIKSRYDDNSKSSDNNFLQVLKDRETKKLLKAFPKAEVAMEPKETRDTLFSFITVKTPHKKKDAPESTANKSTNRNNSFFIQNLIPPIFNTPPFIKFRQNQNSANQQIRMDECPLCWKKHIDLRSKMLFQAQIGDFDCKKTCDKIVGRIGIVPEVPDRVLSNSRPSVLYQIATEFMNEDKSMHIMDNGTLIYNEAAIIQGMNYLNLSLENNYPVVVGVNHTPNLLHNECSTDHFVIIVGRFCEASIIHYSFWDVGTVSGDRGRYSFILDNDNHLVCDNTHNGKKYTVTQIRRNRINGEFITYEDLLKMKKR